MTNFEAPPPPPNNNNESNSPDFIGTMLKTSSLSQPVRRHLSRVYRSLFQSFLAAGIGGYIHTAQTIPFIQGGFISLLISIGSLFALAFAFPFIRGDPSRSFVRSGLFGLFSFSYGLSLGPFLDSLIHLSNDSIIPAALLLTSLIFVSFSFSAVFSQRRSFLFLGGILTSIVSVLSVLGLLNLFFGSELLFNIDIYIGLLVFCGFLLFDTQMIIERTEATASQLGPVIRDSEYQYDTVQDSLRLFMDVISIFIRLAIILAKNSSNSEERKKGRGNTTGSGRRMRN